MILSKNTNGVVYLGDLEVERKILVIRELLLRMWSHMAQQRDLVKTVMNLYQLILKTTFFTWS